MKDFWATEASNILKSILERDGVSYKELARRLSAIGFKEEEATLRNKVNRGTFQFQFFIQCLVALGYRDAVFEVRPAPDVVRPCGKDDVISSSDGRE